MDKSIGADKRRQDKRHKKPHPGKQTAKSGKPLPKEVQPGPVSEPLIVFDDRFSKRPIESHSNFDLPSSGSDSEDDQRLAADFEKLLQVPASTSGHFFLSSEKHWIKENQEPSIASGKAGHQYGQYFRIDTAQLNLSLSSIPLHERNNYPTDIFSKREIDSLKLKADLEAKKYSNKYKSSAFHKSLPQKMDSGSNNSNTNPPNPVPCLIGPGALPKEPVRPKPSPCLIGPDAFPGGVNPLRPFPLGNDEEEPPRPPPCLIGSDVFPGGVNPLRPSPAPPGSDGDVPPKPTPCLIGADAFPGGINPLRPVQAASSGGEEKAADADKPAQDDGKKTKEDMQQWLDDILDM